MLGELEGSGLELKGWFGCVKRALGLESDKMSGLSDRRPFIYLRDVVSEEPFEATATAQGHSHCL
jgi:hypothetical protein